MEKIIVTYIEERSRMLLLIKMLIDESSNQGYYRRGNCKDYIQLQKTFNKKTLQVTKERESELTTIWMGLG